MGVSEPDIAELVDKARAGDSHSLGRLFTLFSDRIYRFLAHRGLDRETAEDLTQTVFLEMIQALPRYQRRRRVKFTTWLFQIARFRLIDHYRKQRPYPSSTAAPEPLYDPYTNNDPIGRIEVTRALQTLPEKHQTVLHLRFQEGMTSSEIATVLGTNALNVRVIQFRALRALRSKLTEPPHEER